VVIGSNGLVAAQNMMYRHSITLYNADGELLHKIKDAVNLQAFGLTKYANETVRGAPVEGAFTNDGKFLWVSNYAMEGNDFIKTGCDNCVGKSYDPGFLYKINCQTGKIEQVIEVGSVPKHLVISRNDSLLLVSNWVSSDVSVIDLKREKEIKRIHVGPHPRGIALNSEGNLAYVAIMGSHKIAKIHLENDSVSYINHIGKAPRSLILSDHDSTLYISLNSEQSVRKLNVHTGESTRCKTGEGPRSMTLSPDGKSLYVVNYFDDQFTKIQTDSMEVIAIVPTAAKPIGICGNWENGEIWVACYSGKIEIYRDFTLLGDRMKWLTAGLEFLTPPKITTPPSNEISDKAELPTIDTTKIVEDLLVEVNGKQKTKYTPLVHQSPTTSCQYYIIIGAFSIYENAVDKEKELRKKGYQPHLIQGKYNYVAVSCAATKKTAEVEKKRIQSIQADWQSAWILEQ
jgi:YVTN family beta-propeller protein